MEWGWTQFFTSLVVGSGSGWVGFVIKGLFDRKKVSIDGGAALSNSALAHVAASDKRMDEMSQDMKLLRAALREHDKWDRQVVKTLRDNGIDVDAPPEIWVL